MNDLNPGQCSSQPRLLCVWIVIVTTIGSVSCSRKEPLTARDRSLNLLVITVDTIRADRLGAYGNTRVRTDFIDELADRGVLFESRMTPTPLTLPSHTYNRIGDSKWEQEYARLGRSVAEDGGEHR